MIKNRNFPSNNSYFAEEGKTNFKQAQTIDWDVKIISLTNVKYNTKKYKSLYEAVSRFNVKIMDNYNVSADEFVEIYTSYLTVFDGTNIEVIFPFNELKAPDVARLVVAPNDTYFVDLEEE